MLNGLYAGAAGMMAQQARIDAIANDVANVNTTGYKSQRVAFRDLVYQSQGFAKATDMDAQFGTGAAATSVDRSMAQGAVTQDGDPFHLAIEGEGFFQVRTADGQLALTRDGSFGLDAQRRLITAGGNLLVPEVRVPAGVNAADVSISADGAVVADGRRLGTVEVVTVDAPQRMNALGDNLFVPSEQSGQPRATDAGRVVQGALETSNVDLGTALSSLIEAQRAYELNSRTIRTADELLSIANQIRR